MHLFVWFIWVILNCLGMGKSDKAISIIETLISNQNEMGSFNQASTSVTRSKGKSLIIETTSMCLIAMIRTNFTKYRTAIDKSVEYLISSMNNGYFFSTQATILALKSLIEVLVKIKEQKDLNEFNVSINNSITKNIQSENSNTLK